MTTLSGLIHKRRRGAVATATLATVATVATHHEQEARTVAGVATVAVAEVSEETTARAWLLHFADRDPLTVLFAPPATHGEALAEHPEAIAAEPHAPIESIEPIATRCCRFCRHLKKPGIAEGYCGERADLPPAYGEHHPLHRLPHDDGAGCKHFEAWT